MAASDLREQLQAALGQNYTVERELGGGGMSRVFLATETALGRKVVVKVLPPEMAAGVNVERFRREIQLAASLQHPHIVPLHAAGQSGDIFYYTMPLVEGESLRAKLAREGELPVGETVRILRDVAEALAYAHAHGVVHRDIKPDNVLISGHHAVVTDFGVAKAVSAASGESSLTSLGIALGTPAYMAPEQAAADPHVDARADLYALGCMAYEMLTGRTPFTGSPQQVLAAHVSLPPEQSTARRATVPPALNALIMRLLEKKPADRVQRADELAATLEAMATPSGGMAPTGATSAALTSDARAAIRRAHPARVTALFGLASVAVIAIVYALVIKLGLPWWVLGAAVALLLVGLPIMLVTGRLERARVQATATGMTFAPAVPAAQWFTWRRATLGGVIAFVGLGLVAAAYTAMRLLGIGPVGTLVAAGIIEERQPIVLAEFENRARDTTLGPTLTEAFRVDLSQSPVVRLADAATLGDALQRMQRPATALVTPELAREIATRQGMKAVVTGQIDPVGKGYVLSASVVAANDGRVLTAVRETAPDDAGLIPAIDRLSKSLRERIGESLTTIRANEPLADVTTSSLEALRDYTEGARLANAGDNGRAMELLTEAVRIDTGFAMAWRKLAAALNNESASPDEIMHAATQAFQHRGRLPELERQQTIAYYYYSVEYDPPKAAAAYRAILAQQPDNDIALNNLGLVLGEQRQFAAADSLFERAIALGYKGSPYANLTLSKLRLQQWAGADSVIMRWASASPADPGLTYARAVVAGDQRDYARADSLAQIDYAAQRDRPARREGARHLQSAINEARGHIAEAERQLRDAMDIAAEQKNGSSYLVEAMRLARIQVRFRNNPSAGVAVMTAALTRFPLDSLTPVDRPYALLAHLFYEVGQTDEARRLVAEYQRAVPEGIRRGDHDLEGALGDLAQAAGRVDEAAAHYHAWRENGPCEVCGLFELAQLYQRAGRLDSAEAYYQRSVDVGGGLRVLADAQNLAASYQRIGELAEKRGDKQRAIEYYGKLLDLWKTADPELQPIVRDVSARVQSLSGPH